MAITNNSSENRGRPKKEKSRQLRGKAFEIIWEKWREESFDSLIDYEEAQKKLGVDDIKSVRAIFRDISEISPEVSLEVSGVRVGRPAFYWNSCRTASEEKTAIAEKCLELIPRNITLACGPGSTVVYCIKHVVQEGYCFVIVTNNVGIIDHVGSSGINDLVFVGGEYNARIHGCVGVAAREGFKEAKCRAALVGVSGINEAGDLFVRHSDEVPVVSEMIKSVSDTIFIVADAHKLVQVDAWKFINIDELLKEKPHLKIYLITNPIKSLGKNEGRARVVVQALKNMKVEVRGDEKKD